MSKYLLIPSKKQIMDYDKYNFDGYILPLEKYSIGYDVYFNESEINDFSFEKEKYVLIDKFLHKKDLENIISIINNIDVTGFIIEDTGLINIIPKNKIILFQKHIINNYESINYLYEKGINACVISNELTFDELKIIRENTKSVLFYNYITRNRIMYSKRKLISNYFENYKLNKIKETYSLKEKVSKKELIIKEENGSTVIFNKDIFCAINHFDILSKYDYLIININNMTEEESNIILSNYRNLNLTELIKTDSYFLENKIMYKVKNNE